jgi:hypothetical protein
MAWLKRVLKQDGRSWVVGYEAILPERVDFLHPTHRDEAAMDGASELVWWCEGGRSFAAANDTPPCRAMKLRVEDGATRTIFHRRKIELGWEKGPVILVGIFCVLGVMRMDACSGSMRTNSSTCVDWWIDP